MNSHRYMPALDGLRAVAVFAVIAYHLNFSWAQGGMLGVGIFFVLSGYLITDILMGEWQTHHHVNMKQFWLRRAKRLLPALFILLVCLSVFILFFEPTELIAFREDMFAALFYASNWWYVFHHVSYFQSFGQPPLLGHLWSLAVEEQFYLIFPIVLVLLLKFVPKKLALVSSLLVLSIISAALMATLYVPGTDPSRVYYGTDTRAFALLIGAALAVITPSRDVPENTPRWGRFILDGAGFICLLVIIWSIWKTNEYNVFLYRGGMFIFSIITAIFIFTSIQPSGFIGRALGTRPLKWLGVRSYGIYLWHYPVIILTSPTNNAGGISVIRGLMQVAITIVIAAVSYHFIERPIRYGKIRLLLTQSSITAVCAGCILFVPAFAQGPDGTLAAVPVTTTTEPALANSTTGQPRVPLKRNAAPVTLTHATTKVTAPKVKTLPALPPYKKYKVTTIGDSIMIDIQPDLEQLVPHIVVNGKVGRQFIEAQSVVTSLKSEGEPGNVVVIELGTNGPFTSQQIESLYRSIGRVHQVIFVNTRVPRPWQSVVNSTLAHFVSAHSHATLVDWYAASANHPGYFAPDGVHLTVEGAKVLSSLIVRSIH